MTTDTQLDFLPGNTVSILLNGAEAYPVMLRAIHDATTSIYLAHFCVQKGKVSDLFYQPLLNAARRGVKVYFLLDAYGAGEADPIHLKKMRLDHINITWFNPRQMLHPLRYNKRLHKKILVVDNKVGFTGGIGISDIWLSGANYPAPWRDTQFRLEGPIVGKMTESFIKSWNRFSSEQLLEQELEPAPVKGGRIPMALADTAPLDSADRKNPTKLYGRLIKEAKDTIEISTAYFGPTLAMRRYLQTAAKRGVRIRILTNGPHPSHRNAMQAGRLHYGSFLKAGIELYEYQPTKTHAKIMVIDDKRSVFGSSNLNTRSFLHDEEMNIVADDARLAASLTEQFEADVQESKKIDLESWQNRPFTEKVRQSITSLGRYFF
ncbi:MAG TPA: phosphatidylserine/phosphatidylglycerophosphate/cardiolipin synthase family protein [Candidatus Polarisedimenticolaceae bacterium]|nr:phosphatidylserine/phosphatidylglycerophosphate/cardiolipin synthase family protein [Candidatus Polarisedimenticolaceae bacterium]